MGREQYQQVVEWEHKNSQVSAYAAKWNGKTSFVPSELEKPYKWKKPKTIFISSMGDLFHESIDDEWINSVMEMTMCCPQHTFILLTKRAQQMFEYFRDFPYRLKNVVCGVSVEDQATANERIPVLLNTPAAKRFISLEPMLGPVDLDRIYESGVTEGGGTWGSWESCLNGKRFDPWSDGMIDGMPRLDGVILGGESGAKARLLDPAWVRIVRDQCAEAGVPFMFKQWGSNVLSEKGRPWEYNFANGFPDLDGKEHSALAW